MSTPREDEEELLLGEAERYSYSPVSKPAILSFFQVIVVLCLPLADYIVIEVLNPFLPALVKSLDITGGDEGKVSIYAGLLQTFNFTSQTLTAFFWNRAPDSVGRKPILLTGLLASVVSMLGIGLSRAYWWLAISLCINGVLNGNSGVIKSLLGEIAADSDQLSRLYSLLPMSWAITGVDGPLIGGELSSPSERYPRLFGSVRFLKEYPFFLPCFITAVFLAICWTTTALFLEETLSYRVSFITWIRLGSGAEASDGHERIPKLPKESERPLPMRKLLRNPRVRLAAVNYACLCLMAASTYYFHPIQLATSIENGGMGFDPPLIGKILSTYGFANGALQFLVFARIHSYLGSKRFYMYGVSCAALVTISFPIANIFAKTYGIGTSVWVILGLQTLAKIGLSMSYGAIFIVTVAAAPNQASLGATNGLCLTIGSLMRAIGPVITNSLFSFSMRGGTLSGNLVYLYLLLIVAISFWIATALPLELWIDSRETDRIS